jgi:hypothetical protein
MGAISVQLNIIVSESAIKRRIGKEQYNLGCTWPGVLADTPAAGLSKSCCTWLSKGRSISLHKNRPPISGSTCFLLV